MSAEGFGHEEGPGTRPGRRAFLTGAGALAGAAALSGLVGCSDDSSPDGSAGQGAGVGDIVAFRDDRQLGVLRAPARAGLVATFDVASATAGQLAEGLQRVSAEIERLMAAAPASVDDPIRPPPDSGVLGPEPDPSGTSIVLGFGASLFDQRFGLEDRRPRELIAMPPFFNDRLVRPERSHGDLVALVTADNQQAAVHALHQLVGVSGRTLRPRWIQEGYNRLVPPQEGALAPSRNLMGFRDGTSNLETTDTEAMEEHVWVGAEDGEPDWAVGGTYLAVRVIRMLIEFWATAALVRQEQIVGRHRDSGAPLGQREEGEEPAFASDPFDESIPTRSHIRLANPREPGTGRILRRGFSYLNGTDGAGALDQGLLFLAFQRSLGRGFLAVQSRLDGEPMEDYIKPVGGGFFFVPPGPGTASGGWIGQGLFDGR